MDNKKDHNNKKIYFSKEIDDKINGSALVLAFVLVGLILQFDPAYFGNNVITRIVQWVFIVVGLLGMAVELQKSKSTILGLDNLLLGILFFGGWFALYKGFNRWWINIIAFLPLFFGAYAIFLGVEQIIYSLSHQSKERKTDERKNEEKADILLFLTKLLGVVLVVIQIIKAVMDLQ